MSLIAIVVASIVLKTSFNELAAEISSLLSGGRASQIFNTSVIVGFVTIVYSALQIPRHFIDTLIYSNKDTIRILALLGAEERFLIRAINTTLRGIILRATIKGLTASAVLYVTVSELLQLYVPATRTSFLYDVLETMIVIGVFIAVTSLMVQIKVRNILRAAMY